MTTTATVTLDAAGVMAGGDMRLGPLDASLTLSGITAVIGANGAGKSLFLGLLHGMLPGAFGRVIWGQDPAKATRPRRGFMAQSPPVLRRTVAANVAYPLASLPRRDRNARVIAALAQAGLSDKARAPAATLSGGELRRMSLARARITQPEVLLLDEPFAGLDPGAARSIEASVTAINHPVIMATHDLAQARRIARQVIFVDRGRLSEFAPASTFFAAPSTAEGAAFLAGQRL
ncbi:MAG: ATP-binding cassette domain-containing protein [Pseudomonadota bacterium]